MTIDEMKDWLITLKPEELKEHYTDNAIKLVMEARDMAIDIIDWYREQDLIKREDALERITHLQRLEKHEDHIITLYHSSCAVAEIPKAEPPFATDTNVARNGTHKPTEWAGRDSASIPYTPKE